MKKVVFVFVPALFALFSFGPSAQVHNFSYDVSIDGRPIGTYLVSRTDIGASSTFKVENRTAAGLIRKSEHRSVMMSLFDENQLVSAEVKTWVNEKLESSSALRWDGCKYVKQEGDITEEAGEQLVSYSSACVFFEEPVRRTSLFYEKYGKELDVLQLADHKYEVSLPNGSKERYTYQNGEVVMVEIVQTFATISLIRNS